MRYSVVWTTKELPVELAAADKGKKATGVVVRGINADVLAEQSLLAENVGETRLGDMVVGVQGKPATGLSVDQVMRLLTSSSRPLRVDFQRATREIKSEFRRESKGLVLQQIGQTSRRVATAYRAHQAARESVNDIEPVIMTLVSKIDRLEARVKAIAEARAVGFEEGLTLERLRAEVRNAKAKKKELKRQVRLLRSKRTDLKAKHDSAYFARVGATAEHDSMVKALSEMQAALGGSPTAGTGETAPWGRDSFMALEVLRQALKPLAAAADNRAAHIAAQDGGTAPDAPPAVPAPATWDYDSADNSSDDEVARAPAELVQPPTRPSELDASIATLAKLEASLATAAKEHPVLATTASSAPLHPEFLRPASRPDVDQRALQLALVAISQQVHLQRVWNDELRASPPPPLNGALAGAGDEPPPPEGGSADGDGNAGKGGSEETDSDADSLVT